MIKRIVRHGNTHAITLDHTLLQLAGIDPDGEVDVCIDKGLLVVNPRPSKRLKVLDAQLKNAKVAKVG